jgi:hypothetical protein
MSRGLKVTLLIYAIVALVSGIVLYLLPGPWGIAVRWFPFDPAMTRLYGAALLTLAVGSWFGYRTSRWEELRIIVVMEIAFAVLSTVAALWGVVFRATSVFLWGPIVIWVAFAAAWVYFYFNRPAEA